jgi:ribose transport system substrate-binding protein
VWSELTRRRLAALIVAIALGATLPACGDGDAGGDAAGGAEGVEEARKRLKRFRQLPRFWPPGPPFDARRAVRGKRIFQIPITSEVPFVTAVEKGMRQAAAEAGAELVVFPNQGRPTQWAQGIRIAISQKADAILLLAQDPKLVAPQIRQARRAGIPVVVLRTTGEREPCTAGTTCIPGPFEQAGRLEADFVIVDSGGKGEVVVITSKDAPSTGPLVRGLEDEFAELCPGCKLHFVDVPIPDWATRLRTEVQSALIRYPNANYLIPIYDSMSQFAVPAIVAANRAERVKIATFNGTPFVLKMLQEEDVVAMDVGENLSWIGWASMDQAFRVIAGRKPVKSENTPLRVFDDSNVDEAGRPPKFDKGYGDAYLDGYRMLWGLSPRN